MTHIHVRPINGAVVHFCPVLLAAKRVMDLCVLALWTGCAATTLDDAPASGGASSDGTHGSSNDTTGGTSNDNIGDTSAGDTSNSPTAATSGNASGGAVSVGDTTSDAGAPTTPPYANVTAVSATGTDGAYTFNVTIESADIDCSQYADWWEVLGEDGALLYRRILEHSHTDANGSSDANAPGNTFTRGGGPVPVTDGDVVVVRAHMSVGGYNGAVMRGSVAGGFVEAADLGADFAAGVELEDPQPDGCEF
jgi:hypothetical protein